MKKVKISQVFQELYQEHYSKDRFQASRFAKEVLMNWKNHVEPTFGNRLVSRVSPPAVYDWHRKYEETPYAGNRSKALLSKIFSHAELKGYLRPGTNPCRAVPNHPEEKRKRYANDKELAVVGKILERDQENFPREVAFLRLLILTGSRPSFLERASFADLHLENDFGFLRLHGKSGTEEVALSREAVAIVESLRVASPSSVPLLPTITGIKFPRYYWEKVRSEVKCKDLWARDFRRTFATTALSEGATLGAVGELLNHKKHQTTMIYAKLSPSAKLSQGNSISQSLVRKLNQK